MLSREEEEAAGAAGVHGSSTGELLPPRAWGAAPTHPFLNPPKTGPKAARTPRGRTGSCQRGETQATTANKTRAPPFISSWFNRTLNQCLGASSSTAPMAPHVATAAPVEHPGGNAAASGAPHVGSETFTPLPWPRSGSTWALLHPSLPWNRCHPTSRGAAPSKGKCGHLSR